VKRAEETGALGDLTPAFSSPNRRLGAKVAEARPIFQ
jgi:hypothetical protein